VKIHILLAALTALLSANLRADAATADLKAELISADTAFSALASKEGAYMAFLAVATPGTKILSQPTGLGPAAIAAEFKDTSPTSTLTWKPSYAEASATGDLGYTWGRFEYRDSPPSGKPVLVTGTYVTIWRRQADGSWKVVLDGGNADPKAN
jgi:ketosteroid isomerase-like protein